MKPIDGEIRFLRHFEHLGRAKAALVPGIDEGTSPSRYVRAPKGPEDVPAEGTDEEEAAWSRSPVPVEGMTSS
jgi:hypothetical protein